MQIEKMKDERQGWTSASNALSDKLCPGRHLAQRATAVANTLLGVNDDTSEWAEFGRIVHAALAASNSAGLTTDQAKVYDACKEIEKKLVNQFFGTDADKTVCIREQRLWVKWTGPGGELKHSGVSDVVYRFGPKALVLEYKTLRGVVPESPQNLQLRDQAVLVKGHLMVEHIGVAVIQPLATYDSIICEYDKEALERASAELLERVIASNDPRAPRAAGEIQCQHCRAKEACLEYQTFHGSHVPAMRDVIDAPMVQWTPEQMAIFQRGKSVASRWLAEADAHCKNFVRNGGKIPGFVLTEGTVRETIVDPATVFDRFAKIGGTQEAFLKTVTVGKTKLSDQIKALTGATGKKLAAALDALIDGCTERKTTDAYLKAEK